MPQQRETSTDQLSNVTQVIQLGRKSGVLTVERGYGMTIEEGSITFVNGQAVQANTGNRVGLDAFNWLNRWEACRFAFLPSTPGQQTAPLPAIPRPTARPSEDRPNMQHSPPGAHSPVAESIMEAQLHNNEVRGIRRSANVSGLESGVRVPVRTRQMEEAIRLIEQLGLSRTHRRLFLLIDGQRTSGELIRLMGREQEEVWKLLGELEKAGVIRQ